MPIGRGTMGETSGAEIAVVTPLDGMNDGNRSRVFMRLDRVTNSVAAADDCPPDVHLGGSSTASRFASFATYARVSSGREPPARCSS